MSNEKPESRTVTVYRVTTEAVELPLPAKCKCGFVIDEELTDLAEWGLADYDTEVGSGDCNYGSVEHLPQSYHCPRCSAVLADAGEERNPAPAAPELGPPILCKRQGGWFFSGAYQLDGHRVRLTIIIDSYRFQSSARAERWSGSSWEQVVWIPGEALRDTLPHSLATEVRQEELQPEIAELLTRAAAILTDRAEAR